MDIRRDESMESFLMDTARQVVGKRRKGVHLTDLMYPRKKFFDETSYRPPTDADIGFFTAGRAHEEILQELTKLKDFKQEEAEWEGIRYNIDLYTNFPTEIKTTRTMKAIDDGKLFLERHDNYVSQLSRYMAIKNSTVGLLWVFYIMRKCEDEPELSWVARSTVPAWRCWWLALSPKELETIRGHLLGRKVALEIALLRGRLDDLLPQCPSWMCGKLIVKKKKGVARYKPRCRYFDLCKPEVEGGE